jgi:hypothetical protein
MAKERWERAVDPFTRTREMKSLSNKQRAKVLFRLAQLLEAPP